MNPLQSLIAVTRRALRVEYRSPGICLPSASSSGSGTGSSVSSVLDISPTARQDGPASLEYLIVDSTSIKLTWSLQSYIYSYVVFRATNVLGPFIQVTANVIPNTFTDVGVPPGTYYYKVTGVEPSFGETTASPTVGPVTLP